MLCAHPLYVHHNHGLIKFDKMMKQGTLEQKEIPERKEADNKLITACWKPGKNSYHRPYTLWLFLLCKHLAFMYVYARNGFFCLWEDYQHQPFYFSLRAYFLSCEDDELYNIASALHIGRQLAQFRAVIYVSNFRQKEDAQFVHPCVRRWPTLCTRLIKWITT